MAKDVGVPVERIKGDLMGIFPGLFWNLQIPGAQCRQKNKGGKIPLKGWEIQNWNFDSYFGQENGFISKNVLPDLS